MKKNIWLGLIWAMIAACIESYSHTFEKGTSFQSSLLFILNCHQFMAGILAAIGFASYSQSFRLPCSYILAYIKPLTHSLWPITFTLFLAGILGWDISKIRLDTCLTLGFFSFWILFTKRIFQSVHALPQTSSTLAT